MKSPFAEQKYADQQNAPDQRSEKHDLLAVQCDMAGNDPIQAEQQQGANIFHKRPPVSRIKVAHTPFLLFSVFLLYYHTASDNINKVNVYDL